MLCALVYSPFTIEFRIFFFHHQYYISKSQYYGQKNCSVYDSNVLTEYENVVIKQYFLSKKVRGMRVAYQQGKSINQYLTKCLRKSLNILLYARKRNEKIEIERVRMYMAAASIRQSTNSFLDFSIVVTKWVSTDDWTSKKKHLSDPKTRSYELDRFRTKVKYHKPC